MFCIAQNDFPGRQCIAQNGCPIDSTIYSSITAMTWEGQEAENQGQE